VFALDFTDLDQVLGSDDEPWRISLAPGETARLPGGAGSVTFDGLSRFANFQVARDPGKEISLGAALLLLVGLTISLGVSRRRVWVRRSDAEAGVIEVAGRSISRREFPNDELLSLTRAMDLRNTHTSVGKEPVA
jgi:cytochrome c biogenesis protein